MNAAALLLLTVAFAFPNEQGTRLLATADIAKPELLRVAVCSDNLQVPVEFERRQPEGRTSTSRQTSQNFANTAGAVFRITKGTVATGATCVLADESFFAGTTRILLQRPPRDARCSRAHYPLIQGERNRAIVGCWPIAASSGGVHINIIEFSRLLTRALAALVVLDGDRRLYVDYPAEFKGPGDDLWRADDGGEIHAEGFEVVFLLKRGSTYLLAVNWGGAEGSALSLQIGEDAGQFKEVISDSWYRAPM
jgi:hypothetical protein